MSIKMQLLRYATSSSILLMLRFYWFSVMQNSKNFEEAEGEEEEGQAGEDDAEPMEEDEEQ